MSRKSTKILITAAVVLIVAFLAFIAIRLCFCCRGGRYGSGADARIIRARGYVRGGSMWTLKNKYPAYVAKVHHYSYEKVTAGTVIIEYDDFDIRLKITAKQNAINEQRQIVSQREAELQLTRVNPLPSDYRNVSYKQMAAKEKLKRLKHELGVYTKLHGNKIISDLAYREKVQDLKDAEADVESYAHDLAVVKQGLAEIYIDIAEKKLAVEKEKLASLESELALLEEEKSYYQIIAPHDGICYTHSDTVGVWNNANTAAVEIHSEAGKKKVICYIDERDIQYLVEGKQYNFRSSQYDCDKLGFAKVTPYFIKKTHSSFGDRSLYQVNCLLDESPQELRINSTGYLEINVPAK